MWALPSSSDVASLIGDKDGCCVMILVDSAEMPRSAGASIGSSGIGGESSSDSITIVVLSTSGLSGMVTAFESCFFVPCFVPDGLGVEC